MKTETFLKYKNIQHGVLTPLKISRETYNQETQVKRTYFNCKCSRCESITEVRSDRFGKGNYIPQSCTNCINSLQKEISEKKYPKETKHLRNRINSIRSAAASRNFDIKLSIDQLTNFLKEDCYYCGECNANGIDRLDSKKDYTIDNCVSCCTICNIMKNKYSLNVFLDKIQRIYNRFYIESSTTIAKASTLQANGSGNGEALTA